MADTISQNNRLFTFDSPLGGSLLCNAFSGTEQMSEIFHFNLELVSEDFNIDWQQMLNKNVTVGLRLSDNSFRYFNGFVIRFEPVKHEGRLGYYKAEMVPWLWFLTQTQNCVVYQNKTVVEVIKAIFDKAGFSGQYDVSKLGDRHAAWINCCQYRESAFDFISRLAEIEGIYYYYKHEQGKHTVVMVDHLSAHLPNPSQSSVLYAHDEGGGALRADDTITDCSTRKLVKPSKYAHKDYNFLIPKADLYHEGDVHKQVSGSRELEIYDYPGEFEWPKDAPDWGTLRQQELEYDHAVMSGSGTVRAMAPGYRMDIANCPRADLDGNYLITSVTHHAHEGSFGAGFDSHPASYDNGFSAIPSSVQFRPTRKTETPDVSSIQTATVVGPAGEEIYTDEYGRVKVHFHWDRTKATENSSCWIRVMQPWAGPNWGQIWIPRVGMEVMVQFLEGDPDRPVITGCLYNEENRPPYKLPDKKNWSGIMSRTTKGGKATEFNELRFDDTKSSELYLMHAQKDMQITVNNDTIEAITRDRTLNVKRNQIERVEADKNGTVKGNHNEKIGGNLSQTVGGNIAVDASGDIVLKAQGNICIIAGGVINLTAGGGITMSGGGMAGGGLPGGGLPGLPGGGLPGLPGGGLPGLPGGGLPGLPGGGLPGLPGGGLPGLPGGGLPGLPGGGLPGLPGGGLPGLPGGGLPGLPGGGLPGAGGCFISVNSQGIIIQGSPMVWLNCNMPAPAGTCAHTPIVPTLPDLSHLAGTTNLGGSANPGIAAMASGAGGGAAAELQQDVQGDAGGELAPEIADAEEGMGGDLASNPWVNPNSLNGPGDPEGTA
jgi:type VI secretion system secreted protein VgrG